MVYGKIDKGLFIVYNFEHDLLYWDEEFLNIISQRCCAGKVENTNMEWIYYFFLESVALSIIILLIEFNKKRKLVVLV